MKDILGKAAIDYMSGISKGNIKVWSDVAEDEEIPLSYLFREFKFMPMIEKKALKACSGIVLDVGAGAGSHSLYLQEKKFKVYAVDISPGLVHCMKERGVSNIIQEDIYKLKDIKANTILLLMNGIGITSNLKGLDSFLKKAAEILLPDGQIIFDTTDIHYIYMDGDYQRIDLSKDYYGVVRYKMHYDNEWGDEFEWLYLDEDTLKAIAAKNNFSCELLYKNKSSQMLFRMKIKQ